MTELTDEQIREAAMKASRLEVERAPIASTELTDDELIAEFNAAVSGVTNLGIMLADRLAERNATIRDWCKLAHLIRQESAGQMTPRIDYLTFTIIKAYEALAPAQKDNLDPALEKRALDRLYDAIHDPNYVTTGRGATGRHSGLNPESCGFDSRRPDSEAQPSSPDAPAQKEAADARCGSPFDINKLCQRPKGHMRYDLNKFGSHSWDELQSSAPDAAPDAQREAREGAYRNAIDQIAMTLESLHMPTPEAQDAATEIVDALEHLAAAKAGERR